MSVNVGVICTRIFEGGGEGGCGWTSAQKENTAGFVYVLLIVLLITVLVRGGGCILWSGGGEEVIRGSGSGWIESDDFRRLGLGVEGAKVMVRGSGSGVGGAGVGLEVSVGVGKQVGVGVVGAGGALRGRRDLVIGGLRGKGGGGGGGWPPSSSHA